jgi:hypothetical protein
MPLFKKKTEENKPPADEKEIKNKDQVETSNEKETASKPKESKKDKKNKTKEKKPLALKDVKQKPVYLEDTGEKLGTIFDIVYDKDQKITGYKIKDEKTESLLSFPAEQFEYNKQGIIFVPGWYNKALKLIEKLEFKDKISPELTTLLTDDTATNDELYEVFVKHDENMAGYIDDAKSLHEMLAGRLKVLEKQRLALKDNLIDLTEKRLIQDIDRRQFSEDVEEHRRKANILDININKCKILIKRLEETSFGILGKNFLVDDSKPKEFDEKKLENNLLKKIADSEIKQTKKEKAPDIYKNKYFTLKEQYEQLSEDYQELKVAVDKLLRKED